MVITLIGMSGVGKTYWSRKLEKKGFKRFGCDDLIENKLGLSGLKNVAKWMGLPFDKRYKDTSREYLRLEEESMNEILKSINNPPNRYVIDTTGSVIYLNSKLLSELSTVSKIVYFRVPGEYEGHMHREYMRNPKPLIWGNQFKKSPAISYPKLLSSRAKKYQALADLIIEYEHLRSKDFTVNHLLQKIEND